MSKTKINVSLGNGWLFTLLTLLFIGLKLTHYINWSWWLVLLPLLVTVFLFIFLLLVLLGIFIIDVT